MTSSMSRLPSPGSAQHAGQQDSAPIASFPKRVATAVGLILSGNILGRILGFGGNVLAARVIGVAAFGMLGMVRSTLSLGATVTDFGISNTASRYVARWGSLREHERELAQLLGLICIVAAGGSLISGAALIWLAPVLAHSVYATPALVPLFVAAVPWLIASIVATLADRVLRGFENFGTIAALNSVRGALTVSLLAVALLLWRSTALGAVLALGAVEAIVALCLLGAVWNEIVRNRRARLQWPDWNVMKRPLRRFAVPSYGFLLLQAPVSWFLLTRLARVDHGSEFVGAVQATGSFRGMLSMLPAALATILLPMLSRLHSLASSDDFSRQVRRLLRLLWFFAVLGGAVIAAALPVLMRVVFGESFGVYAAPCAVLVLVSAWSIVNEVFDQTLAAVGEMWLSFALGIGYALGAIGLTVALVPTLHLWGYVIAQFAAMAVYVIVQQEIVGNRIDLNSKERRIAVAVALLAGVVAVMVSAFASISRAVVYAGLLLMLLTTVGWRLLLKSGERKFIESRARLAIGRIIECAHR